MTVSIERHASALVSAISLSLSALGCAAKSEPPTVIMVTSEVDAATSAPVVTAPAPASSPPSTPSTALTAIPAPPPVATADDSPAPSAHPVRPVASAKPVVPPKPKPQPKRKTVIIDSVEGRPFFVEDRARVASLGASSAWSDVVDFTEASMTTSERAALIAHFTQWSLAEHASIASFARFGMQLLALGAPSHLLTETAAAMQDEIRHARFGFGVVAALGPAIGPQALAIDGALDGDQSLESVLRLCVREGMIGETLAALELMASADLTPLPRLKKELASIGADEARHAQLAYAFAAWALSSDPPLIDAIDEEIAAWDCSPTATPEGLERWGIIRAADRHAIHRTGFDGVVRPLVEQLRSSLPSRRVTSLELRIEPAG